MHRFRIDASAEPQSFLRVMGQFAQRAIVPVAAEMRVDCDRMRIEVDARDLPPAQAALIAAKLREAVAVTGVELDHRTPQA